MKRQPPFFEMTDPQIFDAWLEIGLRERHYRSPPMRPIEQEILEGWRFLSQQYADTPGKVVDINGLIAAVEEVSGKRRAHQSMLNMLRRVATELTHMGIFARHYEQPGSREFHYTLRSPRETYDGWEGDGTTTQFYRGTLVRESQARATLKEPAEWVGQLHERLTAVLIGGTPLPDAVHNEIPWTLSLISQLIERCSRAHSTQAISEMHQSIQLDGEVVDVEMGRVFFGWRNERDHELGLIIADDAQLILAILTMAMQQISRDIEAGRTPTNRITGMDLLELSKRITPPGENIYVTYHGFQRSMARIINTRYRFNFRPGSRISDKIAPGPLEMTKGQNPRLTFSLLENVVEGQDGDDYLMIGEGSEWQPSENMRYFSYSLNEVLWRGLAGGLGWMVHPDLLMEPRGIVHKLYYHMRLRTQSDATYTITGEKLLNLLDAGAAQSSNYRQTRQRFCKLLWRLFREKAHHDPSFNLLDGVIRPEGDRLVARWYDLDIAVSPDTAHADGIHLSARRSPETIEMLERQRDHIERLRREYLSQSENTHALPQR
jgi:hypothetical protein